MKEQKELIERTVSEPSSSQQHLVSVLRKLKAGTSPLLITYGEGDYHMNDDEGAGEQNADDDDDDKGQDTALVTVAPPPTNSRSPEALHSMQQLETSGDLRVHGSVRRVMLMTKLPRQLSCVRW